LAQPVTTELDPEDANVSTEDVHMDEKVLCSILSSDIHVFVFWGQVEAETEAS
jgi:hypothetical protein